MSASPTAAPSPATAARSAPWRKNFLLFLATTASVFFTGIVGDLTPDKDKPGIGGVVDALVHAPASAILHGAQFAGTLLTILVAHELGHYFAARIHKVDASLPFFIPMPLLSPFGTMGAVIRMRGVIPTRRALLDIGASGPLAGLAFALPLYAWGVAHSHAVPMSGEIGAELGESILIRLFDHAFAPPVPNDLVLVYSPVAFGAWGGMFVTMINLLPVGQLDGGHVAYALFGPRQDRFAQIVHRSMLVFFFVIVVGHVGRDLSAGRGISAVLLSRHVGNALFWLVWFQMLAVLGSLAGKPAARRVSKTAPDTDSEEAGPDSDGDADDSAGSKGLTVRTRIIATVGLVVIASIGRDHPSPLIVGAFFVGLGLLIAMEMRGGALRKHTLLDHPPTGPDRLDVVRAAVAIATLVIFALLFMPEPFSI